MKLDIVVGGQAGSECKGHVTAQLAARSQVGDLGICIRVNGPNAGHVVIGPGPSGDNHEWKLRSVPVAAVSNPEFALGIAAGSEVDFSVLDAEITELDAYGYRVSERLVIDPMATVLEPRHIEYEKQAELTKRLGSTAKGIGAARADRIMRSAKIVRDLDDSRYNVASVEILAKAASHVILEGSQGAMLGLHTENYPFTTSGNCRAVDVMASVGLSPWGDVPTPDVYVVLRTRPIRVAGNSGPLEGETTFEDLGWETELTTVTQKVRRIGAWNPAWARRAVEMNGGPADNVRVALMQLDKEIPSLAGAVSMNELDADGLSGVYAWRERVFRDTGARVAVVGTSPSTVIWA